MCELNMQIETKWGCDENIIPRIRRDSFQWGRTHTNKNHDIFPQIQQHSHRMSWGSILQVSSDNPAHYMKTVFTDGGSWSRGTHTPSSWPPSQLPSSVLLASLSSGTSLASSLHLSCLVTHLHCHVTVTLLRDLLLAAVFWCTWCSLRCSHWTLLFSRIEHKANLLWIPADSDYNTKQVWLVWKMLITIDK